MSPEFYLSKWLWVAGVAVGMCLLHLLRVSRVRAEVERRLAERERIAQDLLHTMLQNVQGLVLMIYAVMRKMAPEDPARQAVEETLDRFDQLLAEISNQVQSLFDRDSSRER